ncbi:MAG: ABC transporter ATP-binding protein [Candidatus Bathyarchaeia archaeon]
MAGIRLEGVSKRFGKHQVLKNISFEVKDREFYCLLGPPGAGKTTILRIIAGLEKPDEGHVYIGDELVDETPIADRNVSMFFESLALYPNKTGFENIAFPLRLKNYPEEEVRKKVMEVARLVRVEHVLNRLPRTYSGGEAQRVAFAKTIVRPARAILLDEPLSNIDALLRLEMRIELKRIHQQLGQTFLYATHDQAEAMAMGERICLIDMGEIKQIGTPTEVYEKPKNRFVAGYIGSPPMNFFDCILKEEKGRLTLNQGAFQLDVSKYSSYIKGDVKGKEVILGARPEDIRLLNRPKKGSIEAKVMVAERLGSKVILDMTVTGKDLFKVVAPPDQSVNPGETLWLEFPVEKVHIINKATEEVLV